MQALVNADAILRNVSTLAAAFALQRGERQRRRALDPADFQAIRQAGFHLACLPVEEGGIWRNRAESTRAIGDLLRVLGGADSSVALVCAMHPAVLTTAGWLERSNAPEAYRAGWEAQRLGHRRLHDYLGAGGRRDRT
jgi:hypothetical protein